MDRAGPINGNHRMAFDLPRRPPTLRFPKGDREPPDDDDAPRETLGALGRARPKAPPPSAARSVPFLPQPATPERVAIVRMEMASVVDENIDTLFLDREELDRTLMPGGKVKSPAAHRGPNLPVPHFRSKEELAQYRRAPRIVVRQPNGRNLTLGAWLVAAVAAGIVSFYLAPQARASVEEAVRSSSSRTK
jgi:hypothetical protein